MQQSALHSARSQYSSRSQQVARARVGRKRLTAMTSLPSVQQLATVDGVVEKAASSGYKPSLILEPDLIRALENRVSSEKRRTTIADKESLRKTVLETRKTVRDPHSKRPSRTSVMDGSGIHTPAGQLLSMFSTENSYRLLPTVIVEDVEPPGQRQSIHERGKKRYGRERSTREEFLAEMPEWRIRGQQIIYGLGFQTLMAVLILGNSLVIGLETDITTYEHWDSIENYFLFCFLGELVLKAVFQGLWDLFHTENPDVSWNIFDSFIVIIGLVDFVVGLLTSSKDASFATLFRIIRLLRILRIIRIVKFLKQLYLLAVGLAEAAQAVFWVTILMTFILYVCSIIMVKTVGRPPDTDANQEFLNRHFGAVLPSMLTLFVLMSSPNLPVYQDQVGLLEERPLFILFLVVFIIFGSFGMVALLTGVISESMFEKNNLRKEEEKIEHEKLRQDVGSRCEELYDRFEKDDNDEVNIEDMKEEGAVDDMAKTFESAGVFVTAYDLCTMIEYLDVDGSGTINKDEFMRGMLVLAEGLRPISVQEVHHDVGVCRVKIERIEEMLLSGDVSIKHGRKEGQDGNVEDPNSQDILNNLSEHLRDLAKGQRQMSKTFQDLDGQIREISRQARSPVSDDIASLKAYLSISLQEIGQHVKEQSYALSRLTDAKFGVPWDARSQESCTPRASVEPLTTAGRDSTWSFVARSSVEQVGEGTSSAATAVAQKFFTFSPDQLVPPERQRSEESSRPEVDLRLETEASRPSTLVEAATAANTFAMASSDNTPPFDAQGSPAVTQLPEIISWQRRIESELRRVGLMAQQEATSQAVRGTTSSTHVEALAPPSEDSLEASEQLGIVLSDDDLQQIFYAAKEHISETGELTEVQQVSQPPSAVQPAQSPQGAQAAPVPAVPTPLPLQPQERPPLASAASSPAEPVRHPSALENTGSLAQLLNQMSELISNHEALQRLSVSESGDTRQANEVLECDDGQPVPK